ERNAQGVPSAGPMLRADAAGNVVAAGGGKHVKAKRVAEEAEVQIAPHQASRHEAAQLAAVAAIRQTVVGDLIEQELLVFAAICPQTGVIRFCTLADLIAQALAVGRGVEASRRAALIPLDPDLMRQLLKEGPVGQLSLLPALRLQRRQFADGMEPPP